MPAVATCPAAAPAAPPAPAVPLAAAAQGIDVVPALRIERIRQHRRAEQVPDLAAGHARLDLLHVVNLQQVALLDVRAVDATAGARERGEEQAQEEGSAGRRDHAGWLLLSGVAGPGRR